MSDASRSRAGAVLAVGLALGVAGLVRWPHRDLAISGDEVAILSPVWTWGLWRVVDTAESAMNPPLHRLLIGLAGAPPEIAAVGRWVSVIASGLAVGAAGWSAWRLTRAGLAVLLASVAVAADPLFAIEGMMVRAYPLVVMLLAVRPGLLVGAVEEDGRASRVAWTVATALLPWLHHATVPILVLEAAGLRWALGAARWRRLLPGWGVTAAVWLPVLALVIRWSEAVVGPDPGGSLTWWAPVAAGLSTGVVPTLLALALVGGVAVRGSEPVRVAATGLLAAAGGVVLVSLVSRARLPIGLLTLPGWAILFATAPAMLRGGGEAAARVGLVALLAGTWPGRVRDDDRRPTLYTVDVAGSVRHAARVWPIPADGLQVYPFADLWVLRFHFATGRHTVTVPPDGSVIEVDGHRLRGVWSPDDLHGPAWWFSCDPVPDRCETVDRHGACGRRLVCADGPPPDGG